MRERGIEGFLFRLWSLSRQSSRSWIRRGSAQFLCCWFRFLSVLPTLNRSDETWPFCAYAFFFFEKNEPRIPALSSAVRQTYANSFCKDSLAAHRSMFSTCCSYQDPNVPSSTYPM